MKRVRAALGIAAALAAVILAGLCALFLNPTALTTHTGEILSHYLDADISLGSARLLPESGLTLSGITVTLPDTAEPIFKATRIIIKPDWPALLRLKFRVRELRLHNVSLSCARLPSGEWNWTEVLRERPGRYDDTTPLLVIKNGAISIDGQRLRGLDCELTSFPSEYVLAVRGMIRDPFWGSYSMQGSINTNEKSFKMTFNGNDIFVSEEWIRAFPLNGERIWSHYRPTGIFDIAGSVFYERHRAEAPDFNLLFTGKEVSCRWLTFPATNVSGRLLVDNHTVIVSQLRGTLFEGRVDGYTLSHLKPPYTIAGRYRLEGINLTEFLSGHLSAKPLIRGEATGHIDFKGNHREKTFSGTGELTIPYAKLWKFPLILTILSKLQLNLSREEIAQECRIKFSFSEKGIEYDEITLVSDVLDIYCTGHSSYEGELDLNFYTRPVSNIPLPFADLILQPALDSISGNLVHFKVTGTIDDPHLTVVPLTFVSKQIEKFFNSVSRGRK